MPTATNWAVFEDTTAGTRTDRALKATATSPLHAKADRGPRLGVIDPEVSFGIAQIRGIRTELIAESFEVGGLHEAEHERPGMASARGCWDWVFIMRVKRIRTRPGERQALLNASVRAFCMTHSGNSTRWEILELLVSRWRRIEQVATAIPGRYIYAVTAGGVTPLQV